MELNKHIRTHTGERPFPCDMCPKRFARSDKLKQHRDVHLGIKAHVCHLCNKRYSQAYSLTLHFRSHVRTTSFIVTVTLIHGLNLTIVPRSCFIFADRRATIPMQILWEGIHECEKPHHTSKNARHSQLNRIFQNSIIMIYLPMFLTRYQYECTNRSRIICQSYGVSFWFRLKSQTTLDFCKYKYEKCIFSK